VSESADSCEFQDRTISHRVKARGSAGNVWIGKPGVVARCCRQKTGRERKHRVDTTEWKLRNAQQLEMSFALRAGSPFFRGVSRRLLDYRGANREPLKRARRHFSSSLGDTSAALVIKVAVQSLAASDVARASHSQKGASGAGAREGRARGAR